MRYDPERHHRRSMRLKGRDYTRPGAYFVTMVTQDRACVFGDVVDGAMRLTPWGAIADRCWLEIPQHFANVRLDAFIIMPNHVHGIIVITDAGATQDTMDEGEREIDEGATHAPPQPPDALSVRATQDSVGPTQGSPQPPSVLSTQPSPQTSYPRGPAPGSLGAVVGSFKAAVARQVNRERDAPGTPLWQRDYYEHIIRGSGEWRRLRAYIAGNPAHWLLDAEYPRPVTEQRAP